MKSITKEDLLKVAQSSKHHSEETILEDITAISMDIAIAFMVWKDENQTRFTTFSGGHGFDRSTGERLTANQLMDIFWKEKFKA